MNILISYWVVVSIIYIINSVNGDDIKSQCLWTMITLDFLTLFFVIYTIYYHTHSYQTFIMIHIWYLRYRSKNYLFCSIHLTYITSICMKFFRIKFNIKNKKKKIMKSILGIIIIFSTLICLLIRSVSFHLF